jgi:hypothetical protein
MQVRHPTAVFLYRSHFREFLSPRNVLTCSQPAQSLPRKMPVQSEKLLSAGWTIEAVPQNYDRTVIERRVVVRHGVHNAVERSAHRAPIRDQQIDP